MFLIIPVGVESASVQRWPVVSAAIAAITIVLFLVTWVFAPPAEPDLSRIGPAMTYWEERPYLELDARLKKALQLTDDQLAEWRASSEIEMPPSAQISSEQAELDRLSVIAIAELEGLRDSLLNKLSFVPDRGALHPGWLTSLFVHHGWMHLLGNLLFFYLSALLLEDRWGRPLFLGFYLVGGVVANVAQALVMKDGSIPVLGASGAIAACMGAFAVNMPRVRIRMAYFLFILRIFTGTFGMAAWVAGVLWFGRELLSLLVDDGSSGIAFMAHVGGFAFGAVVAAGFRVFGIERNLIQKHVEGVEWQASPDVSRALEYLDEGEPQKALAVLDRALKKTPGDPELLNAQAMVFMRLDRTEDAGRVARSLLLRALAADDADEVRRNIDAFRMSLHSSQFPPAQALRLGQLLTEGNDHLDFADELLSVAMNGPPAVRNKALVQAARLRFRRAARPAQVFELLEQLGDREALDAATRAEVEALEAEVGGSRGFGSGRAISLELEAPFPPGVSISELKSFDAEGLTLAIDGKAEDTMLPWRGIQELAVAHLAQFEGRANVLLIDLVVERVEGTTPTVLRLPSHKLSLKTLFPNQQPFEAWRALVGELLRRSQAPMLQLQSAEQGALARFADAASFETAAYGARGIRRSSIG